MPGSRCRNQYHEKSVYNSEFYWRDAFIRTYLERDLPQLGIKLPAATLRRFWTMLAHYHGQTWNGSELARAALALDHLYVVCHGEGAPWPLGEGISALPIAALSGPASNAPKPDAPDRRAARAKGGGQPTPLMSP